MHILRVCIDALGRSLFVLRSHADAVPTVVCIEAGGAVTFCCGMIAPRTCLVTSVPVALRAYIRCATAFAVLATSYLQHTIQGRDGDRTHRESWLGEWADHVIRMGFLPLYWEEDSSHMVAAWARCAAMSTCPVLPGFPLHGVHSAPLPAPVHTATGVACLAKRDAVFGTTGRVAPAPSTGVHPVFMWTPDYSALLTEGTPACARGHAWRVGNEGQATLYAWACNERGFFEYSTMVKEDDEGQSSLVRRMLASAGYLAHPPSATTAHMSASQGRWPTLEERMGPGPHMYPISMVPAMHACGVLALAARAGECLGKHSSRVKDVATGREAGQGRLLSDTMLSQGEMGFNATGSDRTVASYAPSLDAGVDLAVATAASLMAEHARVQEERAYRIEQARVHAMRALRYTGAQLRQLDSTLA